MDDAFLAEVRAHDATVARRELEIWIGSEPTFTNARSQLPCWLTDAEGGEKEAHARALLAALAARLPGPVRMLRVEGRTYPGEDHARFCFGALFQRSGGRLRPELIEDRTLDSEHSPAPALGPSQAWLTVTPDPGVIEINSAPAHDLTTFAYWCEAIYAAACEVGLSPTRFRYNGDLTDSGGGGQITLGGPTPARSPFFVKPRLLPGLVRYLNRHPSLSYLFAPPFCGSASQGPRADESVRERFEELPVALDYLAARGDAATPEELWSMLAPLLVDAAGCSHRAEINVEKLWNPWFAGRGQLGLVELRALRMPPTSARLVSVAALFRALAARLAAVPYLEPIVDWGARLHDTYGLPWFLERDIEQVLADLDAHGFGLGPRMRAELLARPAPIASLEQGDASLEIRRGLGFWPLVGDIAWQPHSGARLVDSSSTRVQVVLRAPPGSPLGTLSANGWRAPLHALPSDAGNCALASVLYRAFVPQPGLHPSIGAHDPLVLEWERGGKSLRVQLHAWQPHGGPYPGLPADALEAERRRAERVVVTPCEPTEPRPSRLDGSTLALDLRKQHA